MAPERSTMIVVASSKASFLGSSPTCHPSSTRPPTCATAAVHNSFDGLLYPSTKLWTINAMYDDTPNPCRTPSSRSSKSEMTPIPTPARDNRRRHGITSSHSTYASAVEYWEYSSRQNESETRTPFAENEDLMTCTASALDVKE